jgi:hypothetical protein
MRTFAEMRSELSSRLMVASNSTLFDTTRIAKLITDAHQWATSLFNWPQLEEAEYSDTVANQYYYDYPPDFRTDSISRIYVDSDRYDRKAFEDFLDYKENNPTATDKKIFADYGRQIFIFPTPATSGTANLEVYGTTQAEDEPEEDTTYTIFSVHDDSGNEAIVKKALSVAIAKTDKMRSVAEETEAIAILTRLWSKMAARQQRNQRLDHPMLDVPDYFTGRNKVTTICSFSWR